MMSNVAGGADDLTDACLCFSITRDIGDYGDLGDFPSLPLSSVSSFPLRFKVFFSPW